MTSGVPQDVLLAVGLPPGSSEDQARDLVITVNPDQSIAEVSAANNQSVLSIGELEAPFDLGASTTRADGSIFLSWQPATDPRISGYRVYRQSGSESPISAGFSTVPGFADLEVIPGTEYSYRVVSMSNGLQESEPTATVTIRSARRDALFRDGFETP